MMVENDPDPEKSYAENVAYIDENGEEQTVAKAYILDGTETTLGSDDTETWYVCNTAADTDHPDGLAYNNELTLAGNVHLILADGCKMTATTISGEGKQLTVYAQSGQTGTITATAYGCGVELAQRFLANDQQNVTAVIASGSVADVTTIAGKTLKPLNGYTVTGPSSLSFSGKTNPDFTITTGTGNEAVTIPYYIYKASTEANPVTVTLSYSGTGLVTLGGLPEGTALNAVVNQPLQRTFTMPAEDVTLTAAAVTGLAVSGTYTYDVSAQTPAIKIGEVELASSSYTVTGITAKEGSTLTEGEAVNAGSYTVTVTVTGLGQYIGTANLDFTIGKAEYDGTKTALAIVRSKQITEDAALTLPALPDGASYAVNGTVGGDTPGLIKSDWTPFVDGTTLYYSTTSQESGTSATITIGVSNATNYEDYDVVVTVRAQDADTGGTCGEGLTWELTKSEGSSDYDVLTISGTGAMEDYSGSYNGNLPGWSYRAGDHDNITSKIKYVNIGDGVTTIGNSAFRSCSQIVEITIPASVTSIGNNAFSSCSGLTTVNFADNSQLKTIGGSAFLLCSNLAAIDLAKCTQLEKIGKNAFRSCTQLSVITIPASVTSIGEYAFFNCTSLTKVYLLPTDAPSLGSNAFGLIKRDCSFYVYGNAYSDADGWKSISNKTIIGTVSLDTDITVADPDAIINYESKSYYAQDTKITLSYNGELPEGCCLGGFIVTDANGDNVIVSKNEDSYTFKMPAKDVTVTGKWIRVSGSCGTKLKWSLSKSEGSSNYDVLSISGTGEMDDYSATDLPSWKSSRGHIKTVIIGSGVTTIGKYAFNNSSSLVTVIIEEGSQLTDVGERAFNLCKQLASVNLEECTQLESIGNSAFRSCALSAIAIPAKVTTIGDYAFFSCSNLATFYVLPANAPTIGTWAFNKISEDYRFYVHGSDYSEDVSGWKSLSNKIVIGTVNLGTYITATVSSIPDNISSPVITYDSKAYYAEGTIFTLSSNRDGYICTYTVNGTDIEGNTFEMPDQDVTVTGDWVPFATLFAVNSTNQWATFCDKDNYTLPTGCKAYNVSGISGTTVTLNEIKATAENVVIIPAYTPVLIYRETAGTNAVKATFSAVGTVPASGYDSETGIASTTDAGWTFYGNAGNTKFTDDGETKYVHTIEEYDGTQSYVLRGGIFLKIDKDEGIAAHRCWLNVSAGSSNAARLNIVIGDGDVMGITTTDYTDFTDSEGAWYSLDGRKLDGKPTKKGLYINNGCKVVIK